MSIPLRLESLYPLTQILQGIFRAQAREIVSRLTPGRLAQGQRIDLTHWLPTMLQALRPHFLRIWQASMIRAALQVQRMAPGKAFRRRGVRKDLDLSFSLFNPQVLQAVDNLVLAFCEDTNATAVGKLNETLDLLRLALKEGLPQGEAYATIAGRVEELFTSPARANLIAVTEVPRAMIGGAIAAYQESGVVEGTRWTCTSDPCEFCEGLDGEERPFGEPFAIKTSGNPAYRVVMHAPYHPRCFCDNVPVLSL